MKNSTALLILFTLFTLKTVSALPKLSSLPIAKATIYLDFDGHYVVGTIWNGGNVIDCSSSGLTDAQITEVFNRVSEDYRPFDVNITTDSTIFLAAPLTKRIRVIVTNTSAWYPGVGGVAFVGSFTWGDDTPAFVFPNRLGSAAKTVAESCSHESGHAVGLSHQSKYDGNCTLTATYNDGIGTGETGWAPIMGNSYYKNHTGWSNGPTPGGCNSLQDNLTIITTKNGFGYRPDDHINDALASLSPVAITNESFSANGIITTPSDKDVFQIDLPQAGSMHLDALPFSVGTNDNGANLDIKITLLNSSMQTVGVYDPGDVLKVSLDTTLAAGKYFIMLDGTGNSYSSDYGSLGSYTVSGTFKQYRLTPIHDVALTGKVDNDKHDLQWNIIADEPVKSLELESSNDGVYFNSLTNVSNRATRFSYDPFVNEDIFYRLKVTSSINEVAYSNVIVLKGAQAVKKSFKVSSLVHDEILINAIKNYSYLVADISGRIVAKGGNSKGIQRINFNNNPNGIYIMQIISQNERQTERIIRQ